MSNTDEYEATHAVPPANRGGTWDDRPGAAMILHFDVRLRFADGVYEVQYEGNDEQRAIRALHSTIPIADAGERVTFTMHAYAEERVK